jgi:hypothetical protein
MSRTIYYHRVEITDGIGIIKHADGFKVTSVPVVAESDRQMVVDVDGRFVVVEKKRSKHDNYSTCLDSESIGINTADSVWGNRVSYALFSEKRKRASTIKNEIEVKIKEKLGFFLNGIDLSCIHDKKGGAV